MRIEGGVWLVLILIFTGCGHEAQKRDVAGWYEFYTTCVAVFTSSECADGVTDAEFQDEYDAYANGSEEELARVAIYYGGGEAANKYDCRIGYEISEDGEVVSNYLLEIVERGTVARIENSIVDIGAKILSSSIKYKTKTDSENYVYIKGLDGISFDSVEDYNNDGVGLGFGSKGKMLVMNAHPECEGEYTIFTTSDYEDIFSNRAFDVRAAGVTKIPYSYNKDNELISFKDELCKSKYAKAGFEAEQQEICGKYPVAVPDKYLTAEELRGR